MMALIGKSQEKPEQQTPTKEEKSRFLSDWALQHPLATIREARAALMRQFGITMGTTFISETLRIARQVHEEGAQKEREVVHPVQEEGPRTPQGILMLVRTMRALGLRKVEILADGTFTYEAHGRA